MRVQLGFTPLTVVSSLDDLRLLVGARAGGSKKDPGLGRGLFQSDL